MEAEREVGGKKTAERRNYLSGLQMGVTAFARAVSGHWSVENSLHWVPEVQTGEDDSRAWAGHPAENLATLRRVALSLLKREATKKRGIRGI